jgi:transcriptional regulator with XRE-family HTH domain
MKFSELLSLTRELKGLSLRQVEKSTGISNAFISQVETGKSEISFRNAVKLCDLYNLSLDRLAATVREG